MGFKYAVGSKPHKQLDCRNTAVYGFMGRNEKKKRSNLKRIIKFYLEDYGCDQEKEIKTE